MVTTTITELRKAFTYQPETGFIVAARPFGRHLHREAGGRRDFNLHHGYRAVQHLGTLYLAHRLAWALMTGAWPEHEIDHINGQTDDNRWLNLREVTRSENMQNQATPASCKRRTSVFLGVSMPASTVGNPKPWAANIKINGRNQNLGYFAEEWEAAVAYLNAKDELHPAHVNRRKL